MGSYDFVTADNLEKLFSGLDLATWQKVDLATLNQTQTRCCHIFAVSLCRWGRVLRLPDGKVAFACYSRSSPICSAWEQYTLAQVFNNNLISE